MYNICLSEIRKTNLYIYFRRVFRPLLRCFNEFIPINNFGRVMNIFLRSTKSNTIPETFLQRSTGGRINIQNAPQFRKEPTLYKCLCIYMYGVIVLNMIPHIKLLSVHVFNHS